MFFLGAILIADLRKKKGQKQGLWQGGDDGVEFCAGLEEGLYWERKSFCFVAKESLQCLSGFPCHKPRGHLTYQKQIKMTPRWLTSEEPCVVLGTLHPCGFPKYSKYIFLIKHPVFFCFQPTIVQLDLRTQVPSANAQAQPHAQESLRIFCGAIKHVQHPTATEALFIQ